MVFDQVIHFVSPYMLTRKSGDFSPNLVKIISKLLHFQYSSRSTTIWAIYCASTFIAFTVIKLINYQLHKMYDTSEYIEEKGESEAPADKAKTR